MNLHCRFETNINLHWRCGEKRREEQEKQVEKPRNCDDTAAFLLGLLALGLELVPLGAEGEVVGLHNLRERQPDEAQQVVAEVLVLVEHGHDELLGDVADEEAELLVPGGGEAALDDGRLGAALAQLELHEGVAGAVEVHAGEAPRLHHAHQQLHRRHPPRILRRRLRQRRRAPRRLRHGEIPAAAGTTTIKAQSSPLPT
jgi:hypothetical protein